MYLKRLDLTGFKTFAGHTEFVFNSGVTAIVGPNGCGKSNVADAIRWVLGEQSVRWLRAKKAEDLIYAGSPGRAALGMAEVTLTLDNSQGWLAIPYGEVAITRRAYRSGENEYLLNRQRVRYRDVSDLLARTGLGPGSYSVIGQGLVDAVLSLKPEERRGLFEDAANIRHYYNKLNDARNRLEQTEQNLTRVNDIIAEIQPRLKTLENQARQAQQHASVSQELTRFLKVYYLDLWEKASAGLEQVADRESHVSRLLVEQQADLGRIADRLRLTRRSHSDTRSQLTLWREHYSQLRSAHDDLHRKVAVARERLSSQERHSEDISQEISALVGQTGLERNRFLEAEKQLEEMTLERGKLVSALRTAEKRLEDKQRERQMAVSHLSTLHADNLHISNSIADLRSKISHATERRAALQSELARHRASGQQQQTQMSRVQLELETLEAGVKQTREEMESAESELQEIQPRLPDSLAAQQRIGDSIAELSRHSQEFKTRMELMSKWEQTYSGYYTGVKSVLQASRPSMGGGRLSGIVGVVGKLIQASPEIETAIDVALGSHVQDVVVECWEDAEKAIVLLKKTSGGRATFLPLDTIRRLPRADASPRGPGVLGPASELVRYEPRFQSIVSHLLGHTIVVQDLAIARQILAHCSPGWQIVTLAGEIVRSGGAITGGSTTTTSGILARQRELRELPTKLAEAEVQLNKMRAGLEAEKKRHQDMLTSMAKLETARKQLSAILQSRTDRVRNLQHSLDRLGAEGRWARDQEQNVLKQIDDLNGAEESWQRDMQRLVGENETAMQAAGSVQSYVTQVQQEEAALSSELFEARTSLAVADQRIKNQQEAIERARASVDSTLARIESRKIKLTELAGSIEILRNDTALSESELASLSGEMDSLVGVMQPAEKDLVRMEAEQNTLLADEGARRAAIQELQGQLGRTAIEAQKARDDLEALKIRIEADLGSSAFIEEEDEAPATVEAGSDTLQTGRIGAGIEEVKKRVNSLRDQMRKLAHVNPQAIDEYQEALERHRFLTEQVGDLHQGTVSINRVIGELQKTMTDRFEETFKAVATEFQRYFHTLFGGGTAKLVLTEPGDISHTGVEIIVQPPGRKSQSLSLLSGGERALTAAALLFALLKVNPSPICVLDEVDAALDEANISRFCNMLRDLAQNTQFLVITHNRVTMEIAETLYGISMPDKSVSRVVSLRFGEKETTEETNQSQFASAS